MDINEYTLSLVNNYIEATGMGEARRLSLTPADYLLFRQQAVEEYSSTPMTPAVSPITLTNDKAQPAKPPVVTTIPEKKTESVKMPKPETVSVSNTYEEDDEEDGMEALLRGIPG